MGKVKSAYEKALDEFYDIEDIPEDYLDLEKELGTEYQHVANHYAAKDRFKRVSEKLLKEYDPAYKTLSKGKIKMINTAQPQEELFFFDEAEIFEYIRTHHPECPYIHQSIDPADSNRVIVNYGDAPNYYTYFREREN